MNVGDLKTILLDKKTFVYYAPKGIFFEIQDKKMLEMYNRLVHAQSIDPDNKSYWEFCKLIKYSRKPIFRTLHEGIKEIVLNISGKCNLRCPYCFARDGGNFYFSSFTIQQANDTIDFCFKQNPMQQYYSVCYFGGEPMLNFHVIEENVKYIKKKYPDKKVGFSLTTNGTVLNDRIVAFLKDYNFTVLVSFDGIDNDRPFSNGKSSTQQVLNNISILKNNGVNICIRATILTNSRHIYENIKFLESLNNRFEYAFVFGTSNEETNLSDYSEKAQYNLQQQFQNIFEYYLSKIVNGEVIYCQTILSNIRDLYFKILTKYPCSAGLKLFTFNSNGDIYACQNNANDPQLKCGNIHTGIISRKLRQTIAPNIKSIAGCRQCWARYICAGGCPSEKIAMGLTSKGIIPNKCQFEKIKIEFILKLICAIQCEKPSFFVEQYNQYKQVYGK